MKLIHKGFTLIELLIVIALLGALAVGLLATVDPFEQLKKGTDTSRRNTTTEVYNAAIRFYAIKNIFPWASNPITASILSNDEMTNGSTSYIQQMIDAGELKPEFIMIAGSAGLSKIRMTSTADANGVVQNVSVCFLPESKAFANDQNAKYATDGAFGTNCTATSTTGGGQTCYWCIK